VKKLQKHKGRHEHRKVGKHWFNTLTTSKFVQGWQEAHSLRGTKKISMHSRDT